MAGGPLDVRFINRWACVPTSERYKVVFFLSVVNLFRRLLTSSRRQQSVVQRADLLCHVYNNLLYLRIWARHIRLK